MDVTARDDDDVGVLVDADVAERSVERRDHDVASGKAGGVRELRAIVDHRDIEAHATGHRGKSPSNVARATDHERLRRAQRLDEHLAAVGETDGAVHGELAHG